MATHFTLVDCQQVFLQYRQWPFSNTHNQYGAKTMNKFESRQSQPTSEPNEGWVVQVYGSNRRLLWVLEPSHGWIFLLGCSVGVLISVFWFNLARLAPPVEPAPPTETPKLQID